MARSAAPSSWQTIADFRPGVAKNLSPAYPPGTAQELGTWRCYALPSGALAPIPITHTQTFSMPDPVTASTITCEQFRIIGLHTAGPVYWPTNRTTGTDQNNTEIFVGVEWWVGNTQTLAVYRYRRHYSSSPTWTKIWDNGGVTVGTYAPDLRPAGFHFGTSLSNHNNPDAAGPAVITWVGAGWARFFPDDTANDTDSNHWMPGDKDDPDNILDYASPDILCMHAGRCIIFPLTTISFGANSVWVHNESFYYTEFNDFRTMDRQITKIAAELGIPPYWIQRVGGENPFGWGCVASLSSNELFLLKRKGGAIVYSGDLAGMDATHPALKHLPFVKSPGFSMNNGTLSPKGYIYPVDNGTAWMWSGGDFSTNIAPQLEYNFWRPKPVDMAGNAVGWGWQWTQCDCAHNFVLFPNNWVLDSDTSAWWKIDDPSQYTMFRWSVDWHYKKAYGTTSGFRGGSSGDPTVLEFDTDTPASSYAWQSQPIATTIDKSVNVLNMGIVGSGVGTVTLKVTTRGDHVGRTRSFTFTDDRYPEFQSDSAGVRGTHLTFEVTSTAANPGDPAPVIHEIRYEVGATVPGGSAAAPI